MSIEEYEKISTPSFNFDVVSYEDQILDKIMDELSSDSSSEHLTNDSPLIIPGIGYYTPSLEEFVQTPTTNSSNSTISSDHEESNIPTNNPNNNNNNRKKRKYHVNNISRNKKYLRIPRIVNSDLRKKYPIMLINVLNSCNYHLMKEFFYFVTDSNTSVSWEFTRYRPDHMHAQHRDLRSSSPPPTPPLSSSSSSSHVCIVPDERCHIKFQHISDICNYLFHASLSIPDRTYQILNCEIFTRSDSFETKIVVDYRMTGTKTYQSNPHSAGVFIQSLSESLARKERRSEGDEESLLAQLFYEKTARIESPRPMLSEGKMILIVENYRESMKINKIIFEGTSNQARFRR